jgi:hypothetical protein
MRRAVLLLVTMALAILAASGVAGAILNGQPDGNRHPYVGALVADFDGQKVAICSGTLISPTVFITAGHCTDFLQDEGVPTYVSFDPTFDQSSTLVSGTPHTHPLYRQTPGNGLPEFDAYDVGVVVLDEPVTMDTYGELPPAGLVETLRRGQQLSAVGYGANDYQVGGGPPSPVYFDIRYRANVKLVSINNRVSDMFLKLSGASAGQGGEGTCFGDSGGPIFLPDQTTIVGNNSFVTNGRCAGVTYAQRMDLPKVLNWVRGFL